MPVMVPVPIDCKDLSILGRAEYLAGFTRRWVLYKDWAYDHNGMRIFIPQWHEFDGENHRHLLSDENIVGDFDSDGSSIPKIARPILNPVGVLLIPGLVHDFGYKYNYLLIVRNEKIEKIAVGAGKSYFDDLFREIAIKVNGMHMLDNIAHASVKYGGKSAWNKHRKGEKK